jgi:hypothetical protein
MWNQNASLYTLNTYPIYKNTFSLNNKNCWFIELLALHINIEFRNLLHDKSLWLTQPLTEMSTRNLPGGGGKERATRKADNLTAICQPIV